jgi:hypothetical protein
MFRPNMPVTKLRGKKTKASWRHATYYMGLLDAPSGLMEIRSYVRQVNCIGKGICFFNSVIVSLVENLFLRVHFVRQFQIAVSGNLKRSQKGLDVEASSRLVVVSYDPLCV